MGVERTARPDEGYPTGRVGTVWLVGAGPGDPELITLAGLNALRRADVVVYDRLAPVALLREAPAGATMIDAGKAPGAHTLGQDATNATLAEHALAGRTVVRLKGGDPFVFGRGGEEALFLRARGVPFRVVPGVTSAVAAPAFAGIPVTHRGVTPSLLIATGHEGPESSADATDWEALARAAGTLVFLMGVERLPLIAERLLRAGRPAAQPAALVRLGGTPDQVVLSATLGTIAAAAQTRAIQPPATLVVGDVVALREELAWYETLPLFGARVLVTRTRERASGLVAGLRALGALPLEFPAIVHASLDDPAPLDRALAGIGAYRWAVFTSENGVGAALDRLCARGLDARHLAGVRVCAVGPATARALAERGIRADLVPARYADEGVVEALAASGVAGERVVVFQSNIAPATLPDGLVAAGAAVTRVAAYRTAAGSERRAELERLLTGGVDAVTFTSSSTVTHLLAALDGAERRLSDAIVAAIGPSTAATARAAGLAVTVEAEQHTVEGLIDALVAVWRERRGRDEEGER